jgi:FdhD protein
MADASQPFDIVKVEAQRPRRATDRAAAEVPLEVRLNGESFSVIMRTPGADCDLAIGFLFSEGIIGSANEIDHIDANDRLHVVNVALPRERAAELSTLLEQRRNFVMNSSCGLCGRRSLDSLELGARAVTARCTIPAETIAHLPGALREAQWAFAETGGLHAAGLFDLQGNLETTAEDVGRHNAVDKVIGRMLQQGRVPLDGSLLFVSGRSSFEIVQEAFLGGIPFVAAVSAPSSLAIELARTTGITLLGFVRDGNFNIYANEERIEFL